MRITLCLLLFCVVQDGDCEEIKVAAIVGKPVQLQPVTSLKPGVEINWNVKLDSGKTYRILTFSKGELDFGKSSYFAGRVNFDNNSLSLLIDPVNKSDSGLYTFRTETGEGNEHVTEFNVSVFDHIPKPNLTVLSAHLKLGWCNFTLSCSVPGIDTLTYSWSRGRSLNLSNGDQDHQLHQNQSQLQLVINADSNETFYRCNTSNQASWAVTTVDVKTVCSSQASGSTGILQVVPWWVFAIGIAVLLLLTFSLIFLCKQRKKQRSCRNVDQTLTNVDQILTVYEEVDDSRTRRNANGNAQNRILGNTIYAEVNTNLQPAARAPQVAEVTVYAAVQRPSSVRKQKINPSLLSTIYMEVQEAPSRPRYPQKQCSSSPNPGHLYS